MLENTNNHFKILKKISSKSEKKSFSIGMYSFLMYMIDYYSRVRKQLKLDYDSFIIVQVVLSHNLYTINKKKNNNISYNNLGNFWGQILSNYDGKKTFEFAFSKLVPESFQNEKNKLTISSVCLITNLPKETVRRKIIALDKKGILKNTKKVGVVIGEGYKKIFTNFVPTTLWQTSKLVSEWEKSGIIKNLLEYHQKKNK